MMKAYWGTKVDRYDSTVDIPIVMLEYKPPLNVFWDDALLAVIKSDLEKVIDQVFKEMSEHDHYGDFEDQLKDGKVQEAVNCYGQEHRFLDTLP